VQLQEWSASGNGHSSNVCHRVRTEDFRRCAPIGEETEHTTDSFGRVG